MYQYALQVNKVLSASMAKAKIDRGSFTKQTLLSPKGRSCSMVQEQKSLRIILNVWKSAFVVRMLEWFKDSLCEGSTVNKIQLTAVE